MHSLVVGERAAELLKSQLQSLATSTVIAVSCATLVHKDDFRAAPIIWLAMLR